MLKNLIDAALREVGICEIPMGSNDVKYNHEYWGERSSYADLPWCVVFCWWICRQVGIPFPNTAHCNGVEAYAKEHGQWVTGGYQVGDMVIFDYDKDGSRDHIGLLIEISGSSYVTIEGNYGDKVAKVKRKASEFVGAYRPDYAALDVPDADVGEYGDALAVELDPAEEPVQTYPTKLPELHVGDYGVAVGSLQVLLRHHGYGLSGSFVRRTNTPDCEFGPETKTALMDFAGKDYVDAETWLKLIGGVG